MGRVLSVRLGAACNAAVAEPKLASNRRTESRPSAGASSRRNQDLNSSLSSTPAPEKTQGWVKLSPGNTGTFTDRISA